MAFMSDQPKTTQLSLSLMMWTPGMAGVTDHVSGGFPGDAAIKSAVYRNASQFPPKFVKLPIGLREVQGDFETVWRQETDIVH
jgi:hypothetical protein